MSYTADFRTHPKYAKRVYHCAKPLWHLLHAWDAIVADRLFPELSFGYSTLTVYPQAGGGGGNVTCDGRVSRGGVSESWSVIRTGAGTDAEYTASLQTFITISSTGTENQWYLLLRSIFTFDTSALGAGVSISDATFSLYGSSKADDLGALPNMNCYAASPANDNVLVAADYQQAGSVVLSAAIPYTAFNIFGYNNFVQNASGLNNINKTGVTRIGVRNANYDVANIEPSWAGSATSSFVGYFADYTGVTQDPKLIITYTIPPSQISGSSSGSGVATGPLKGSGKLAGTATSIGAVMGIAKGVGALVGGGLGSAAIVGTLTLPPGQMIAPITATAFVVAAAKGTGKLAGSSAGVASVGGSLKGSGALVAPVAGISLVFALFKGSGALAGSSKGTTTIYGLLSKRLRRRQTWGIQY